MPEQPADQTATDQQSPRRGVVVERTAAGSYRARSAAGATIDFGTGEGQFSPVELLLAAVGGCTAVDVDVVTSRRSEPERFEVEVSAQKVRDDQGAVRLEDVEVLFRLAFPDDEAGRQAMRLVPRLVQLSHEKDCTVSRTVELPTHVSARLAD